MSLEVRLTTDRASISLVFQVARLLVRHSDRERWSRAKWHTPIEQRTTTKEKFSRSVYLMDMLFGIVHGSNLSRGGSKWVLCRRKKFLWARMKWWVRERERNARAFILTSVSTSVSLSYLPSTRLKCISLKNYIHTHTQINIYKNVK